MDSKYRFSEDSLTSVSRRDTNTLANRLAALMLRSVALPIITRLFVVLVVDLVVAGLPLSSCVVSSLRFRGTVCHSGLRTPGSTVVVCHLSHRLASTTRRSSRSLPFRFASSTRRSSHGSRKADTALGRCTGCCVSCADASVVTSIDTCVITVASGLELKLVRLCHKGEAASLRSAHSPPCIATDDRSSVQVTAWAATFALNVSSSEIVVCSCDSKVHTSRLLNPIGGNLPRSTATKVTLVVIASCLRVNSHTMSFKLSCFFLRPTGPFYHGHRHGQRFSQITALWQSQCPLRCRRRHIIE